MPVFGGWLRNVPDEGMPVDWGYVRALARESEAHGFDLSLVAELNLNDIKGHHAPSLDAWTLGPAVAAVTERLELMLAVRPNYHAPALTAKAVSTLDLIAPGRVSLNVVSSWWKDEAAQYVRRSTCTTPATPAPRSGSAWSPGCCASRWSPTTATTTGWRARCWSRSRPARRPCGWAASPHAPSR
jgi:hypothetical protein